MIHPMRIVGSRSLSKIGLMSSCISRRGIYSSCELEVALGIAEGLNSPNLTYQPSHWPLSEVTHDPRAFRIHVNHVRSCGGGRVLVGLAKAEGQFRLCCARAAVCALSQRARGLSCGSPLTSFVRQRGIPRALSRPTC